MTDSPRSLLKKVFGFDDFRPHQESIILETLKGRDVFAALPTGGGKSLCYQLPALLRQGLTVVVSPLIALMKDQVDTARASGIQAACLNSAMDFSERNQVHQDLKSGQLKLLYMAPERLGMEGSFDKLAEWNCCCIAVDEAHCISEWGHEFRPDYRQLIQIRHRLPLVPIMAFTATATRRVQEDILKQLALYSPCIIRAGFDRPEIFYRVEPKRDTMARIAEFVKKRSGRSGIIYRSTRADVDKTSDYLNRKGLNAAPYHAGLSDKIRRRNQDDFKTDKVAVIVATVAFGMGIDKPDIRFVIHGDLPKSLESFYQETGRAGRDGDPAETLLLWNAGDMLKNKWHIDRIENPIERERSLSSLKKMLRFADTFACRRRVLLDHFDEQHPGNCGGCDVCNGEVESVDATEDARKILSAAARTNQRFGGHYLVDIVRGTLSDKIREWEHQNLPTFGVGAEQSRKYWLGIIGDLEAAKCFYRDEERYKALVITEEGKKLLLGKRDFRTVRRVSVKGEKSHTDTQETLELEGEDLRLFEELKILRLQKAREIGKPPYVIFPDRTLRAFAAMRPHSDEQFLQCPGVGEKKLSIWGDIFLAAIRDFENH